MNRYIQQLRERDRQGQANVPKPFPDTFIPDSIRRDSLVKLSTDDEQLFSSLENIPANPYYQAVIDVDKDYSLMEWDIHHFCQSELKIQVEVTARRSRSMLFFNNRILVNITSPENFADMVMRLRYWKGIMVYYNQNPIPFPDNYSVDPIRYGINYARVSTHWVTSPLDVGFFVAPLELDWFYKPLAVPGCVLGPSFHQRLYYNYQPLTESYTGTVTTIGDRSDAHFNYMRAKTRFLKMLISSFPKIDNFNDPAVYAILCPQEQRLFVQFRIRYEPWQQTQTQQSINTNRKRAGNRPGKAQRTQYHKEQNKQQQSK